MQYLHPKAVWLFFFHSLLRVSWFIVVLLFIVIYFGVQGRAVYHGILQKINVLDSILFYLTFIPIWFVVAYVWARLSYRFYRFEISKDVLKIERGVIWKKYVSIPYDRIQNVDIHRGVIDRILGLSDIQVQTAGFSFSRRGVMSEGRLPGLSIRDAEKLRETLIQKASGGKQGV
jgi:membrane protein YdbS with pleckstrin-like domain